ncbi:MAG: LysR family transcriptional regulator [Gammaproteobacteria bacterium]|nr:LysR family transcriptional regulator [Gammaproteobacteria bacterium]
MDIELLKTFLEVKKTRHFGKAAENLYLTQAAVSARIKQLEQYMGTSLFTRYRNNLQLTAVGERLTHHAETILIAWDRAQAEAHLRDNQRKIIAIGGTSGLWDLILQGALNEIHKHLPDIALRAESHGQDILIRRLVERTMDLGLLYEPTKVSDLISVPVTQAELILVSTEKHQDIHEALNQDYVSIDWGTAVNIAHTQIFQDIRSPVLYTTLAKIALEFILYNGGSAYLPLQLVDHLLEKELYHIESAPVINRPIYACYHKENLNEDLIKDIINIINDMSEPELN